MGIFDRIRQSVGNEQFNSPKGREGVGQVVGPSAGQVIARAAAIDRMVGGRQTDELIGICRGLIADGTLVGSEIRFLADWLERSIECSQQWPYTALYGRVRAAMADGQITEDEEKQLFEVLAHVSGTPAAPSVSGEAVGGGTEGIPYDDPAPAVTFDGRSFCVTGDFAYGPRDRVVETIETRGGRMVGTPSGKTHFLVVGLTASTAWKHSTHGTKIIRALELREAGKPIAIIGEKHWTECL